MKRIALFVGINAYPESPLRCARADAETLYREFYGKYDATKLLVDKEASLERIVSEIEDYQKVLSPGDMFLFYFSGHGCEQNGDRLIAIPRFDVRGNPLELAGLTIDALKDMTDIKGLHRLFVLDCCRNVLRSVEDVGARGKMAGYLHRHGSRSIIQPTILSSSAPGQTSYEHIESGHGYFTEAFLAAIRNSEVRSFNMFRDRIDFEMQSLRTPASQDPYFEGGIGSNLPFWPTWEYNVDFAHNITAPATANGVALGDIVEAFNGYSGTSFFIGGNIPEGKRRNAWNSMRVNGHDAAILALYDATFWGGAREGVAMTSEGLYAKDLYESPTFLKWNDIVNVEHKDNHLWINGQNVSFWYASTDDGMKVCDAIASLAGKTTVTHHFENTQQSPFPASTPDNCNQSYASQQTSSASSERHRFHLTVEDTFNMEQGFVLSGVVKGGCVTVGDNVEILRWDRVFCRATIVRIERQRTLANIGNEGDLVGLLIQPDREISFTDLEPGMVVRTPNISADFRNNLAGRKLPSRRKKSNYPHVVLKNKDGALVPEPGYAWVDSSRSDDFSVKWIPGCLHPDIPHILASSNEGVWIPADGYEWDGPRRVRKK